MDLLYKAKVNGHVGGVANDVYISSTEIDSNTACYQSFGTYQTGTQMVYNKWNSAPVRAVRVTSSKQEMNHSDLSKAVQRLKNV